MTGSIKEKKKTIYLGFVLDSLPRPNTRLIRNDKGATPIHNVVNKGWSLNDEVIEKNSRVF